MHVAALRAARKQALTQDWIVRSSGGIFRKIGPSGKLFRLWRYVGAAAIPDAILGDHTAVGLRATMALECINPEDLPVPLTYTHVIVATGTRLVFVSGQEPEDHQGNLVGYGDLASQARQVFANLGRALAAGGARPEQVVKITIYVVNHKREYLQIIEEARLALFGDHKPADTLVGIATLSNPDYLIEVDAIAVVDGAIPLPEQRA